MMISLRPHQIWRWTLTGEARIISFGGLCATTSMGDDDDIIDPDLKVSRSKGQLLLQLFGKLQTPFHF